MTKSPREIDFEMKTFYGKKDSLKPEAVNLSNLIKRDRLTNLHASFDATSNYTNGRFCLRLSKNIDLSNDFETMPQVCHNSIVRNFTGRVERSLN